MFIRNLHVHFSFQGPFIHFFNNTTAQNLNNTTHELKKNHKHNHSPLKSRQHQGSQFEVFFG